MHQKPLRTLLLRLAKASDKLPASLFLDGVIPSDSSHPDLIAGGFADIHIGEYNNREVALKVIRVFSTMNERARHERKQVSIGLTVMFSQITHYDRAEIVLRSASMAKRQPRSHPPFPWAG